MQQSVSAKPIGLKFERRYHDALRRQFLAPTIGRIGLSAEDHSEELAKLKNRRRTELKSTLAEGLKPENTKTVLDTHYVIEAENGKLVAEDGEPIEEMNRRALDQDIELASEDNFFADFLPQRSRHEFEELREWEAMIRGEADYNTLITFSPYSEEYDDGTEETRAKLLRAAQKPYWRRGMFRVVHAHEDKVHIFSYSIDNSSVELMRETASRRLGYEFKASDSTEMLGERIPLQVDDDSWWFIAAGLVAQADNLLAEKHGGIWRHGHNPEAEVRRAQAYVESQIQIVDSLIEVDEQLALKHAIFEDYDTQFQDRFYDCLALLEKRLELGREAEPVVDYEAASAGAGSMARAEGKVYDACGLVIGPGQTAPASVAQKTGLESLKRLENRKIKCPECDKSVIVPKEELSKGQLSCSECGYWLDVCTGKKGFNKKIAERVKTKVISGFELISNWFKRQKQEAKIKKIAGQRAERALGGNVTSLDKKRHEKQVRKELEQ